jgi:hypothetical protein
LKLNDLVHAAKVIGTVVLFVLSTAFLISPTRAGAPRPIGEAVWPGPNAVTSAEYRLPARYDGQVAPGVQTEIWARVYRPVDLSHGPYPLLVFLHGNHGTCGRVEPGIPGRFDSGTEYTFTGVCPPGFIVTPNHLGYAYVAERLASWGYVVVSINANRGVTAADGDFDDPILAQRRGRLILRHLDLLDHWNVKGGTPKSLGFDFKGKLDFNHIGLMGHSRGGEGVLAAYTILREPGSIWPALFNTLPVIEGIFALAPTDYPVGQAPLPNDVAYVSLLPLCDGDVVNLDGLRPFNRVIQRRREIRPAMKAAFGVWGANHNFFNTEWQQTDSEKCFGTGNTTLFNTASTESSRQRFAGLYAMMSFFRSQVGVKKIAPYTDLFNPSKPVPAPLAKTTPVERSYSESASNAQLSVVDDFNSRNGQSTRGVANDWQGVTTRHKKIADHNGSLYANALSWNTDAQTPYFQSNGWDTGGGTNIDTMQHLEFRVSLACSEDEPFVFPVNATAVVPNVEDQTSIYCFKPLEINGTGNTDFSVALVTADNHLSAAVPVSRYATLHNPVGMKSAFFSLFPPSEDFTVTTVHPFMQTVRAPLRDFGLAPGTLVRGVRLIFNGSPSGSINVTNIRFSRPIAPSEPVTPEPAERVTPRVAMLSRAVPPESVDVTRESRDLKPADGVVASIRRVDAPSAADARLVSGRQLVEIEIAARRPIAVRDSLLILRIGSREFLVSRYVNRKTLSSVAFTLTEEELRLLPQGAAVELLDGSERRRFGVLNKANLR